MLHINELTYRIEGRTLFERATVGIPEGHKVGLVGRNGTGKTTLLKLISGELAPDDGSITWPKRAKLGYVAQEAPGGPETLLEWVLSTDLERRDLLAEAETATDPERISEIHLRLADIGAHTAEARAARLLSGLGFDAAAQARPCSDFSGGWRMRVALASVLFLEPEFLLLDEPTNYLDLEGTLWLQSYLANYPHTVLIVSHDRDLLNVGIDAILHLEQARLSLYTGGYDTFEETRRERQRLQMKLKKKQDDERRRIEAFVNRFRAQANKAAQAQSRIKVLEKMRPIAASVEEGVAEIRFPQPAKQIASPLLRIEDGEVGYAADAPVLTNLNLRIDRDDRIALLGQNGNGKSTLAKLLSARIAPLDGKVFGAKKVEVGYFAQHQLDELNGGDTPYDVIERLMPEATVAERRARLGGHGFGADKADTKASHLSGGEKARLLLMIAGFSQPNLLILDEPTNHLDVDSREALIHGLNDYEGAVILISHDRHLIEATADRLWVVADGSVTPFAGTMDEYRTALLERRGRARDRGETREGDASSDTIAAVDHAATVDRSEARRQAAVAREKLAPLRKEAERLEARAGRIAAQIAKIDDALADGALFTENPERAQTYAAERGRLARMHTDTEDDWLTALDAVEQAEAAAKSAPVKSS
ncbi:MAG: ATP-binding cassette domain-containing protein [Pseudomonadota bacterium]